MKHVKNIVAIVLLIIAGHGVYQNTSDQDNSSNECPISPIVFGIDISQYQGDIDWDTLEHQTKHPIEFIIVRSTMGKDGKDAKFPYNFDQAKSRGFIVGAYHYYRPNEKSTEQAINYLESVKLEKGDFIPILDIEKLSTIQTKRNLRKGIKNWLDIVEASYGRRPMIYTGLDFYKKHIWEHDMFAGYPIWVAAYSPDKREDDIVCAAYIHQFSEKITVPGIDGAWTDGNDIRRQDLERLLLK